MVVGLSAAYFRPLDHHRKAGVLSIEQRLQSSREAEEEKIEGRRGRHAYALGTTEFAQREGGVQLPPAGAPARMLYSAWARYERIFVGGRVCLGHRNNRFEDGYEAQLPTVTVGADYRINEWLLAGLALNYTNYDGTYDDSGGSDKHIFGPLLYATFVPFEGAFANVILGYARQENRNNRLARRKFGLPGQPGLLAPLFPRAIRLRIIVRTSTRPASSPVTISRFWQRNDRAAARPFSHRAVRELERRECGSGTPHNNLDQTSVQSSLCASVDGLSDSLRRRGAAGGGRLGP